MQDAMNASYLSAVLLGGSIAAALDITFAISFAAYNGVTPIRLLQTVASGLLGTAAFTGGVPVAAMGLVLHFVMSFLWAGVFLLLATVLPALMLHPAVSGIVFGAFVFLAMRLIVLPLSAYPYPVTFKPIATVLDLLSHSLLFGVPIAWAIQKVLLNVPTKA
jgi:uncharacterized membrane protein YagU involved in acid resistance